MASFAIDSAQRQTRALAELIPPLLVSPAQSTVDLASLEHHHSRLAQLQAALLALDRGATLPSHRLAALVDEAFGDPSPSSSTQLDGIELLVLANVVLNANALVLTQLVTQAERLSAQDEYWNLVESRAWHAALYLVQTKPSRLISLAHISIARLRQVTSHALAEPASPFSLGTLRQALPASLLVSSLFPHLRVGTYVNDPADLASTRVDRLSRGTRRLMFLTLSPLTLARGEVGERRKAIDASRNELADSIGRLTIGGGLAGALSAKQLGKQKAGTLEPLEVVRQGAWETLRALEEVLSPSNVARLPQGSNQDLSVALSVLLTDGIPAQTSAFATTLARLHRPSLLTRAWPFLLVTPAFALVLGRTIYNSRATLLSYAQDAGATVRGFVVDWVYEPIRKILETVRHGEQTGLTLIGRESLRSDLESLERMVIDFGREEYGMSPSELVELGAKVRVGDLTDVLRVWERDIKRPIRSAVGGSLIRTLLIQVQKLKVDGAIAMNGIERLMDSQQLTFGFVGVTPSLLIVVGVERWMRGLLRSDGGEKSKKQTRRKVWRTMRHLDAILSPSCSAPTLTQQQTQGYLLLELNSLRQYAASRSFPSRDSQLVDAFLNDVRELEDCGTVSEWEVRRVLVDRLWRWGTALGWNSIV